MVVVKNQWDLGRWWWKGKFKQGKFFIQLEKDITHGTIDVKTALTKLTNMHFVLQSLLKISIETVGGGDGDWEICDGQDYLSRLEKECMHGGGKTLFLYLGSFRQFFFFGWWDL